MTIRRFHYTGRKRINHQDAKVFINQPENGSAEFDAVLSLSSYALPPEAEVSVEAYRQTSWMRFSCGTISSVSIPDDRKLVEFDSPDGLLFRVRVTQPGKPQGLLLAEADQIRPRLPEDAEQDRIPIIQTMPFDLEQEIYRVDYSDRPVLLINSLTGDWRAVTRTPVFISLVLPAVMREILTRILLFAEDYDIEDLTDWRSQWVSFAMTLPGIGSPPPDEDDTEIVAWIDEAVTAFCRRFSTFQKFKEYWTEEESQ